MRWGQHDAQRINKYIKINNRIYTQIVYQLNIKILGDMYKTKFHFVNLSKTNVIKTKRYWGEILEIKTMYFFIKLFLSYILYKKLNNQRSEGIFERGRGEGN
jgi:hypothetical protein